MTFLARPSRKDTGRGIKLSHSIPERVSAKWNQANTLYSEKLQNVFPPTFHFFFQYQQPRISENHWSKYHNPLFLNSNCKDYVTFVHYHFICMSIFHSAIQILYSLSKNAFCGRALQEVQSFPLWTVLLLPSVTLQWL